MFDEELIVSEIERIVRKPVNSLIAALAHFRNVAICNVN